MSIQSAVRVLIIDNDPRVGADLKEMLDPDVYSVRIAQGIGQDLLKDANDVAQSFRPHVAIVDLRLLDEYRDERSGFGLLESLQSARCILYSAHLSHEVTRDAVKRYKAVSWVSKGESPLRLLEAIDEAARGNSACRHGLGIIKPPSWTTQQIMATLFWQPDYETPPDMVEDILCQMFPENQRIVLQTLGGEFVTKLPASHGHSVVFKAMPDSLVPVVVKFAPANRIEQEAQKYREFIENQLEGLFYARLESHRRFWDLGGAIYTFMGTSNEKLETFAQHYKKQSSPEAILRPLEHFFTQVWKRHYDRAQFADQVNLFDVYDDALKLREHIKALNGTLTSDTLINLFSWVRQHAHQSLITHTYQGVTHGDLHADNLFVDNEHAWAIDFERSGPSHVLRDFVELEVDIFTRLIDIPPEDPQLLEELARSLVKPSKLSDPFRPGRRLQKYPETLKGLEVIEELRKIAYQVTRCTENYEYYWGILLDTLFVASFVKRVMPEEEGGLAVQRQRALLYASVICERLRDWHKELPQQPLPAKSTQNIQSRLPTIDTAGETMNQATAKFDVFLSYNRDDQQTVERLAHRLRTKSNLRVWLDKWNLLPGDPWQEEIEKALEHCTTCVVCWGPSGISPWQNKEMRSALVRREQQRKFRVIPLLLPGCRAPKKMPSFLSQMQWVDFQNGLDNQKEMDGLVAAIRRAATKTKRK